MNTSTNASYVMWMIVCGIGMGTVFDFYNTIMGAIRFIRPLRAVVDLLYWTISGLVVYFFTYRTISGSFRIWTFLLLIVGYLVYRVALRRVVIGSAFVVLAMMRRIVLGIARILYRLIGIPLILCWRLVFAILRFLYAVGRAMEDVVARMIVFIMMILLFPVRRYLKPDLPWRKKLENMEKGFWNWVSKVLQKKPRSVS